MAKTLRPRFFYAATPPYMRERIGGARRSQLEAELTLNAWAMWQTSKGRAKQTYRHLHPVKYEVGRRTVRAQKQLGKRLERTAERAVGSAVGGVVEAASPYLAVATSAAQGAAGSIASKIGTGTKALAPLLIKGGVVVAAGLASYILTTVAIQAGQRSREERERVANNTYRHARAELKRQLGLRSEREIPPELMRPLTDAWKQSIARKGLTIESISRGGVY